jgi:hypothetical protein
MLQLMVTVRGAVVKAYATNQKVEGSIPEEVFF